MTTVPVVTPLGNFTHVLLSTDYYNRYLPQLDRILKGLHDWELFIERYTVGSYPTDPQALRKFFLYVSNGETVNFVTPEPGDSFASQLSRAYPTNGACFAATSLVEVFDIIEVLKEHICKIHCPIDLRLVTCEVNGSRVRLLHLILDTESG